MMGRYLVIVAGFAGLALAPVAEAQSAWPMYQANEAHTGYVPVFLDPQSFSLDWDVQVSSYALNPVAAAEGKVFVTDEVYFEDVVRMWALDADDGSELWSKSFGAVYSVNPPAYGYGNVYVQVGKGGSAPPPILWAFAAADGAVVWQAEYAAQWEHYYAPTVYDGKVYVDGGYYGGMYAFEAMSANPQQVWFCGTLNQFDEWTPAVDADYAYAYTGDYSPKLSIVNRATGVEEYSIPDPGFHWTNWSMNLAPVLGGDHDVIVVQPYYGTGRLISFDVATLSVRFEINEFFSGQPSLADWVIYVINDGNLEARGQGSGSFIWAWDGPEDLEGTLIVTRNHVLAHSATTTWAVSRTTHLPVWSYPAGGHLALSEGVLYIARSDGTLTALRGGEALFADGFETADTLVWSSTTP